MNEPLKRDYTTAELRQRAQNERLISRNQRGESAAMLDWAADKLELLTTRIYFLENELSYADDRIRELSRVGGRSTL